MPSVIVTGTLAFAAVPGATVIGATIVVPGVPVTLPKVTPEVVELTVQFEAVTSTTPVLRVKVTEELMPVVLEPWATAAPITPLCTDEGVGVTVTAGLLLKRFVSGIDQPEPFDRTAFSLAVPGLVSLKPVTVAPDLMVLVNVLANVKTSDVPDAHVVGLTDETVRVSAGYERYAPKVNCVPDVMAASALPKAATAVAESVIWFCPTDASALVVVDAATVDGIVTVIFAELEFVTETEPVNPVEELSGKEIAAPEVKPKPGTEAVIV